MKVYELLDSPEKWSKDDFASKLINGEQVAVDPNSPDAEKWDILGAIDKCYGQDGWEQRILLYERVGNLVEWNYAASFEDFHKTLKDLDI